MSLKLKLMLLLTGSFILLAPMSVATGLSIAEPAKYFRLLSTMLIVGLGVLSAGNLRLGTASLALIGFVVLFVLSGAWSGNLAWAFFNKGMFGFSCCSGMVLACSIRSMSDMQKSLRFLGLISGGAALVALMIFLKDPAQVSSNDRMAVLGINPNMIGHTAVPLAVLCMYVAINDRRKFWRALMIGACAILGLIIMATGCRGAALTMLIGTACLLAPYSRRPGVLLGVLVGVALVGYVGLEVMDIGGSERMVNDIGKNTRAGIWKWAIKNFQKAPLIGVGWLHYGSRQLTCLSIYLQTLAEMGIIGAISLFGLLCVVAKSWLTSLSRLHRLRASTGVCYLALSLLMVELVHGLTESGPIVGTTLASLALGLGIGLTDRAGELFDDSRRRSMPLARNGMSTRPRRRPSAQEVLDSLQQKHLQFPTPRPN